jgi:4'-phosphopantetheinyl transferase EntD
VIEALLPVGVCHAEARDDPVGVELFPEEEAAIARAVEKRRREFATGRSLARRALRQLGFEPCAIPMGRRGEPLWPAGVAGSITHCKGYRACAAARRSELATLGIDAEPHEPLPSGLLADVASAAEQADLARLAQAHPGVRWERLLFSAKESVFKAWWPLTERPLGFEQARIAFDPGRATFTAHLLVAGPSLGSRRLQSFDGRWSVQDGLILTAIAVASPSGD